MSTIAVKVPTISDKAALPLLVAGYQAQGPFTAKAIESTAVHCARMEAKGLIVKKGVVKSGKRGRPANVYSLTDKARKRAKRALQAA